ncbi:hypothetical protein WA026_019480 [Henosepilachna vigintioctopunctata]|uniref:Uncharacterized protein n=1 Tax=Henosepilachna vigintioctopunctata TaxID=420089 RepID=A0AAW1UA67_9CUCU
MDLNHYMPTVVARVRAHLSHNERRIPTIFFEGMATLPYEVEGMIVLGSVGPYDIHMSKESNFIVVWCMRRCT